MRKIITSDIHGCFSQFVKGLEEVKYNPTEDKLILLGDYIDRGTHSAQVVKYVRDLQEKYNVIALLGNHEDMAIDAHERCDYSLWNMNGGTQTHKSYYRGECNSYLSDINWFKNYRYII